MKLKKLLASILCVAMVLSTMGTVVFAEDGYVAKVGDDVYKTLVEAIVAANPGDTVTVINDVSDEAVSVTKNITLTSDVSNKATLNNVVLTMNGTTVELTVSNLKFTGSSYINANDGAALTVTNCEADVNPTKITGRAAFIVVGTGEPTHGLKLVVTDNTILSAQSSTDFYSAAIFGWRYLADGTNISNNIFGSESTPYCFVTIKLMNAMNNATFTLKNNTVYGSNKNWKYWAFDLYQNCSRDNTYTVISEENKVIINLSGDNNVAAFYLEGKGGTNLIMLDSGTTVNGKALTMDDVNASGLPENYDKFYGINVTLDENGKIISGILSSTPGEEYVAEGYEAIKNADGTYTVAEASIWTTDSDAGFYYTGETKYGMMRFLFKADITDTVTEVGIKYINEKNIFDNVTGESATGAAPITKTGDIKAFYGDIVNIPEKTQGKYYAAAYVKTEKEIIWSDIVNCSINWTQQFANYRPTTTGGAE